MSLLPATHALELGCTSSLSLLKRKVACRTFAHLETCALPADGKLNLRVSLQLICLLPTSFSSFLQALPPPLWLDPGCGE